MGSSVDIIDRRRTIVTALPLRRRARAHLAQQLGDARIVDIREPVDSADLVLAPSCSPQTIGALKDAYPTAQILVVEIEDWELGIDLPGPVKRLLAAGADGYVSVDSLDELAVHLGADAAEHSSTPTVARELPATAVDDVILSALADRLDRTATDSEAIATERNQREA